MSTPQNQLYSLNNKIQRLSDMFEAENEDESDIFAQVKDIHSEISILRYNQAALGGQLSLIIKLLTKE